MNWWKPTRNGEDAAPAARVTVGAQTNVGPVRLENQDTYGVFGGTLETGFEHLFVVADGMGGHSDGGEASQLAVEVVRRVYFQDRSLPAAERMKRAITEANTRVYESAQRAPPRKMGTTCTALAVIDVNFCLGHVGDSRAYRIRPGSMEQLTDDHTYSKALVREGVLTAEEAAVHPRRHALVRAIGVAASMEVDVRQPEMASPKDRFLLCSDGLEPVPEHEIQRLALDYSPQEAAERLVQRALDLGTTDNVTVLIVCIES
jgi:PPM family protein phosphatase